MFREEAALLRNCLLKLTPAAWNCIELAYFQGLSYSEVSLRVGRPLGTVKTTIRKSLRFMRARLAKQLRGPVRLVN